MLFSRFFMIVCLSIGAKYREIAGAGQDRSRLIEASSRAVAQYDWIWLPLDTRDLGFDRAGLYGSGDDIGGRGAVATDQRLKVGEELRGCRICADRFAQTATRHMPRPVVWFQPGARIILASQAPGARAHAAGRPFADPSGVRLRDWLGVDEATFYDQANFAIVPMGFCFPGYDRNGSDLPPPRICAQTWRQQVLDGLGDAALTLLIGGYAQSWHLGGRMGVTERVATWRDHAPRVFPLPHPSWRNTAWLKRNPWFEADVLPALKRRVSEVLS